MSDFDQFFWVWWRCVLAEGFAEIACLNVVFGGVIVVECVVSVVC